MNKKKLICIISVFIIIVGLVILLIPKVRKELTQEPETNKEITEEDYKVNPKYILEEVVVSDGKHLKLPKVDKVWNYKYQDGECIVIGALELSEQAYNDIINQMDNELNIPRFEESTYKNMNMRPFSVYVDDTVDEQGFVSEGPSEILYDDDMEVIYLFKREDCKYQTKGQGKMVMGIFMCEKYNKHYMAFCSRYEYRWFYAQ